MFLKMELKTVSILLSIVTLVASYSQKPYEVLFAWKQLDYQFPSPEIREEYLRSGAFIPENNVITGIKVSGSRIFLSAPRFRQGVPSTLNYVNLNDSSTPPPSTPLIPYPSWEMQEIGNCSALQGVMSMEIDEFNRMWIVDVGNGNVCPAKIIIVDLETDEITKTFVFPNEVVNPNGMYLNDVVVGCHGNRNKCWAYISDSSSAKLVIYSMEEDRSWFVHHKSMELDPNATNFPILGKNYTMSSTINGIGLSPKDTNHSILYYTSLASFSLYSIPTSALSTTQNGDELVDSVVTTHTTSRPSQSGGMTVDSTGVVCYARMRNNSVVCWDTKENGFSETLLVQNDIELQWPDTFGYDQSGWLYFTTPKMHLFSNNQMDWSDTNFRVVRVFTGTKGYMFPSR